MFTYKDKYAYVGQSIDIEKRLSIHKREILERKHPNLECIPNYNIEDFSFIVLSECSKEELNQKEIEYFDRMSLKYIMLNKRDCGLQGVNGERLIFYDNKNPNISFSNGNFYIDNIKVDRDENGFYCLSDITNYIMNHTDYDFRQERVLINNSFIERINCLYKCEMPKDRRTPKHLKDLGLYRVVGARDNKKVYCDFGVFVTYVYMSCPQFAASVAILIGKRITNA